MSTHDSGSPTPIPEDKLALRVMCWYQDHVAPEVMMVENVRGEPLHLTKADWLKALCTAEGKSAFIDHWSERHGDWTPNTLATLVVATERTTMTVLLRLAHVTYCEGLGVEISLLEQARGRYAFAKLEEFNLTNKNGGRPCRIAVWSENVEDEAKIYNISSSRENTFTLSSHPALLQQAVGVDALPSTPTLFELWDVSTERWVAKKIGEAIVVEQASMLVLVRHLANGVTIGIGYAIAELQLTRDIRNKKAKLAMFTGKEEGGVGEPAKKKRRTTPLRPRSPIVVPRTPNGGRLTIDLS